MEKEKAFQVSPSPHLRNALTTEGLMWAVVLALVPAVLGGAYFFGTRALAVTAMAGASAVAAEAFVQSVTGRKITIADGSALVTGILVALVLPPGVPYWLPVIGSVFAIVVVKAAFGGLGYNLFNPSLAARAFLFACWPAHMTSAWITPSRGTLSGISGTGAITEATPLGVFRMARGILADSLSAPADIATAADNLRYLHSTGSLKNLLVGNVGGSIGETSAVLLGIGAAYLMARRIISWRIPVSYLGTVALITWLFGGRGLGGGNPLFHILSGGLMLGACFMATDVVTSPVTPQGRLVFGIGCGILTGVIRLGGAYPEGVCYSILVMNMTVPLVDRFTRPRILGEGRK